MMDMGTLKKTAILILLFFNAWKDWRKKEISLHLTAIMAVWGLLEITAREGGYLQLLIMAGTGALLTAFSVVSQGAIGIGDILLITALGILLSPANFLELICAGTLLAGGCSLVLLIAKRKKRDAEIPFVPFLFLAYVGELLL